MSDWAEKSRQLNLTIEQHVSDKNGASTSFHRCLINSGVEKMNYLYIWIRALTTGPNVIKLFTSVIYEYS